MVTRYGIQTRDFAPPKTDDRTNRSRTAIASDSVAYRDLIAHKAEVRYAERTSAAKSAFFLVESRFDEASSIKLDDSKKLGANIKTRLLLMKPLRDAYQQVILDYKQAEWAVAALYMIAKASDDFAIAIQASPIPNELSTDAQRELYRYELAEQFRPVEDSAVEYYARCIATAAEYRIDSDMAKAAVERMKRLRPNPGAPSRASPRETPKSWGPGLYDGADELKKKRGG